MQWSKTWKFALINHLENLQRLKASSACCFIIVLCSNIVSTDWLIRFIYTKCTVCLLFLGVREMPHWVKVFNSAFPKYPSLVPSIHVQRLTTTYKSNSQQSDTLFWRLQPPGMQRTHITCRQSIHTLKNKDE